MEPDLYMSAQECLVSVLRQYDENQLHEQLDQNMNNLLHVCAQFHDSAEFVKEILDKTQSSKEDKRFMLTAKNSEGETALHIASRNGRSNIVLVLIERAKALDREYQNEELESGGAKIAKELMRATDKNGDMALHVAARNKHTDVVELLLTQDPHFKHPANTVKETPLYLAIDRRNDDIVYLILTKCTSQNYECPGGKTALHAAVLSLSESCVERILRGNPALTRQADESGWIPLHYAAYVSYISPVVPLLIADRSTAYTRTSKDDNRTALHIAACQDNLKAMKELLRYCPDCWNMVTSQGQNLLHLVLENKAKTIWNNRSEVLKFILDQKWAINLINQKDAEGNTPLHLYAKRASEDPVIDFDVSCFVEHPLLDKIAVNNQNSTAFDVMLTSGNFAKGRITEKQDNALWKLSISPRYEGTRAGMGVDNLHAYFMRNDAETRQRVLAELRKRAETHLLVATLIATVTFAAGFTLPGGYDGNASNNQGMAVLLRKAAFTAFVVTDAVALMSSLTAVFLHFSSTLLHDDEEDDDMMKFYLRQRRALVLIVIAMMTVVIAFVTGLYTVLQHGSLALAITICAMGCLVVLLFCFMLRREIITLRREIITCLVYFFYDFLHIFSWYLAYKFLEYCKKRKIVGSEI